MSYSWQHQQPHKQAKQQVELTSKKTQEINHRCNEQTWALQSQATWIYHKVVRKAINFWCTNITITITTTIMSIFCWKGNWRESWQGQTTSGKPQHDLSFQNSSPLHSSLKQLQQLHKNTFSTFFSSRFMESRRARSFMTQLYPPFLALTRKSGVCSFFERKNGSRYITAATIDPIVDLKRGDGYCIIGRLINKN